MHACEWCVTGETGMDSLFLTKEGKMYVCHLNHCPPKYSKEIIDNIKPWKNSHFKKNKNLKITRVISGGCVFCFVLFLFVIFVFLDVCFMRLLVPIFF